MSVAEEWARKHRESGGNVEAWQVFPAGEAPKPKSGCTMFVVTAGAVDRVHLLRLLGNPLRDEDES